MRGRPAASATDTLPPYHHSTSCPRFAPGSPLCSLPLPARIYAARAQHASLTCGGRSSHALCLERVRDTVRRGVYDEVGRVSKTVHTLLAQRVITHRMLTHSLAQLSKFGAPPRCPRSEAREGVLWPGRGPCCRRSAASAAVWPYAESLLRWDRVQQHKRSASGGSASSKRETSSISRPAGLLGNDSAEHVRTTLNDRASQILRHLHMGTHKYVHWIKERMCVLPLPAARTAKPVEPFLNTGGNEILVESDTSSLRRPPIWISLEF